jgi:hypothetical protein
MRSLVYAQRDWAGGELVMSFRRAFDDLIEFLRSDTVRQKHFDSQKRQCQQLVRAGGAPSHVIRVNEQSLAAALEPLRSVADTCGALMQRYEYGLVYALKFTESDVLHLSNCGGSGILYRGAISVDRIVGKAKLFLDDRIAPRSSVSKEELGWYKSPLAEKIRHNPTTNEQSYTRQNETRNCPEWLGDDISLEIARAFGDASVQAMLNSGRIIYNEY